MRFGLPSETQVAPPDWSGVRAPTPPQPSIVQTRISQESQLSEALAQLELRNITRKAYKQNAAAKALNLDIDVRKSQTSRDFDLLDSSYSHVSTSQLSVIQGIIEEEERLRKEEEKRQKELEIARQKEEQRKKEEKEREEQRRKEEEKKRLEEEKKRKELELQKKEAEKQEKLRREKEAKRAAEMKTHTTDFLDVEKQFRKWQQEIVNIKKNVVAPISQNKESKRSLNALRRKITVKFGQLSNSEQRCTELYREIEQLIQSVRNHPQGYPWILNAIAKAIVSQAETEVTVKASAALPLAFLAHRLLREHKEFDYYLTARFVKKCCFIIGYTCAIDTEEGRKRMGWRRTDDKWEDEVKYEERVGGIMSLWSAISRKELSNDFKHFNRGAQWTCLARILNTKSELIGNVHYYLVSNWWEISSYSFLVQFRNQAHKLYDLIETSWTEMGKERSFPAATRLQILVEESREGNFNAVKEMER